MTDTQYKTAERRSLVEQYEPGEYAEQVLSVLKEADGTVATADIREATGFSYDCTRVGLNRLLSAGWIEREKRGSYRFVEDPRRRGIEKGQ